jgi:O-antigen/teichoic acid export membrane protein
VRAGAAIGSARLSSLLLAAVQLPLLTRIVPADSYAQLPVATGAAVFFGLVAADPVVLSFQRFPGSSSARSAYSRARQWVGLGLVIAAAAVLLGGYILHLGDLAFAVAGWGAGLAVNRFAATAWLMWGHETKYAINLSLSTLSRTGVLILAVAMDLPLLLAVGVAGIVSALVAVVLAPAHERRSQGGCGESGPRWTYRFGAGLTIAQLSTTVLAFGAVIVVPATIGVDRSADFAAMSQVAVVASAALNLLTTALYPRLRTVWDKGAHGAARTMIGTAGHVFVGVGATAAGTLLLGDGWLLRQLLPDEFVLTSVIAPMVAATAFSSIAVASSWVHQLSLRARTVAVRASLAAAVGTTATVALAAGFGGPGGAAGSLVGFILAVALLTPGTTWMPRSLVASLTALALTALASLAPAVPPTLAGCAFLTIALTSSLLARRNHRHALASA